MDSCSKCGEKRGAKLHLSEEYLDSISDEDIRMSIENCSVQLADGKYTENYKASVFITSSRITPNRAKDNLPYFTINRIGYIAICFADRKIAKHTNLQSLHYQHLQIIITKSSKKGILRPI